MDCILKIRSVSASGKISGRCVAKYASLFIKIPEIIFIFLICFPDGKQRNGRLIMTVKNISNFKNLIHTKRNLVLLCPLMPTNI